MDGRKTYAVLSRIRCSGTVYAPGTDEDEIELGEKEAARLLALGSIGEKPSDAPDDEGDGGGSQTDDGPFDLKDFIVGLLKEGVDVSTMKMADLHKRLGKNKQGVNQKKVKAILAEIDKEQAG